MASPTITTTYAGEKLQGYISAALLSGNTLDSGIVSVKPNIKYKEVIKTFATGDIIAAGTCDFTDSGTITIGERYLTPKELQVNVEVCKDVFRSDWDAISMGFSAHDNLPKSFQDYLTAHYVAQVAEAVETQVWHGDDSATQMNGLVPQMTADADVVDVVGASIGAGGVTAANVVAELGKVADAIPHEIYSKAGIQIIVAPNVYKAYVRALGTQGFVDRFNNQSLGALLFDGIPVIMANGLTSNYMVAGLSSNLWFATGLFNDYNEVKVLDMADLDGSQNVRFIMRFTADTNYGIGSELVLYTPVA
jgi:hypothetical protein